MRTINLSDEIFNSSLKTGNDHKRRSYIESKNIQLIEVSGEIEKLPQAVRIRYSKQLQAFDDFHKGAIEKGINSLGKYGFPIAISDEVFQGYLVILKEWAKKSDTKFIFIESGNPEIDYLLELIVAIKILSEGDETRPAVKPRIENGVNQTSRISFLEKEIVEKTNLQKHYPLFLKLAVDGGPEYSRIASKLLTILKTRNFQAKAEDTRELEEAIHQSNSELLVSNNWNAINIVPVINENENVIENVEFVRDWTINFIAFEDTFSGQNIFEKYRVGMALDLANKFLTNYKLLGKVVTKNQIEVIVAACVWLVKLANFQSLRNETLKEETEIRQCSALLSDFFNCLNLKGIIGPELEQVTRSIIPDFDLQKDSSVKLFGGKREDIMNELDMCLELPSAPHEFNKNFLTGKEAVLAEGEFLRKHVESVSQNRIYAVSEEMLKKDMKFAKEGSQIIANIIGIMEVTLEYANSPEDLLGYLKSLYKLLSVDKSSYTTAAGLYKKVVDKFAQTPGALNFVLTNLCVFPTEVPMKKSVDVAQVIKIFTNQFLRSHPIIIDELAAALHEGNYKTFENACLLSTVLINSEKGWGEVSQAIGRSLFSKREDCFDPNRVMVLRNIMQGLKMENAKVFFKKSFAENSFFVGVRPDERLKLSRMLSMDVDGKDAFVEILNEQFIEFNDLEIEGKIPDENIKALTDYIVAEKTIVLSADGKKMPIDSGDSILANNFREIKFSLNKETRKNVSSLACNVSLTLKSGSTWYFSINAENELIWRQSMGEGKFMNHTIENLLTGMPEFKGQNVATNKEILDEIQMLILRKLESFYVKKAAPAKDIVIEAEPQTATPEEILPDSGQVLVEGTSIATERHENPGVVDLAFLFAEAVRMAHDNLGENDEEDDVNSQVRLKIGGNRQLALQIFGKALAANEARLRAGNECDLLDLPEEMPEGLADLIVYTVVSLDGDRFYEEIDPRIIYAKLRAGILTSKDVFVRYGSAHSQTLPYKKMEAQGDLDKVEIDAINKFWRGSDLPALQAGTRRMVYEAVKQSRADDDKMDLRMEMFSSSRENREINLEPRSKILYFDVDDLESHRNIFDKMKSKTAAEIEAEVRPAISRELKEKIKQAKALLVNPELNGAEYIRGLDEFEMVKFKLEAESEELIKKEVSRQMAINSKFVTITHKNGDGQKFVKLRLPAVFDFEQTFNQGKFQTLKKMFELLDTELKNKYDEREVA